MCFVYVHLCDCAIRGIDCIRRFYDFNTHTLTKTHNSSTTVGRVRPLVPRSIRDIPSSLPFNHNTLESMQEHTHHTHTYMYIYTYTGLAHTCTYTHTLDWHEDTDHTHTYMYIYTYTGLARGYRPYTYIHVHIHIHWTGTRIQTLTHT